MKAMQSNELTSKRAIIHARVFKGKKSYDENNNLISENQSIKLIYGSNEAKNFFQNAKRVGFTSIDLISIKQEVRKDNERSFVDLDEHFESVKLELNSYFQDAPVELTPDQKRIAELERMVKELSEQNKTIPAKPKAEKKEVLADKELSELEKLQKEYHEKAGKKPHHLWKEDKIKEELGKL